MLEEGFVRVQSHPPKTLLAEKFEPVVSRGIANKCRRDHYDVHTLVRTMGSQRLFALS